MNINPLFCIDFYKSGHIFQYPKGTERVYSNFTPRSIKNAPTIEGVDDKIVFFGLQYFIKYFLLNIFWDNFFAMNKKTVVENYKRRMDHALGVDAIPMDHIEALHDLRYLPISIRALPEGSCVNQRVPVLTIENTHTEFFWLVNYLESVMSCMLWKMCTSATIARKYRQILNKYALLTGADQSFVKFQGHDFSFRGMSGIQDAVMSGAAHLLSFVGTDTVSAIGFLEQYYYANVNNELVGCSVPATEHSVMCMGGQDCELDTFRRLITEIYPSGIVSIVSDSWDFWKVITEYLPTLKPEIMARMGKVVIRPDSGDPVKIICGDWAYAHGTPEHKGAIQCLWETFGGTITENGYKVLDKHIGLIYGDSITLDRCQRIMNDLARQGFASTNVVLGIGSFTYQHVTRDTFGFAVKSTAGIVNGQFREIFKDPKTDNGVKKSARGLIRVFKNDKGDYELQDQCTEKEAYEQSELVEVFRDGLILTDSSLSQIRERIEKSL